MKKINKIIAGVLATTTIFSTTLMAGCELGDTIGGLVEQLFAGWFGNAKENTEDNGKEPNDGNSEKEDTLEEQEKHNDFISLLGGVSETYTGEVSKAEYKKPEDAAEAFVREEVGGEMGVNIVNTTTVGELNEKEIDRLNIPAADKEGIVRVEEMEVEYMEPSTSTVAYSADTLNKNKTIKVYVIKYTDFYKYYTSCPVTGETVTKSYYESVFDAAKYENCTMTTTGIVDYQFTMTYEGETVTISTNASVSQTVKYSKNAIYLEQRTWGHYSMTGVEGDTYDVTVCAYLEKATVDGKETLNCYLKTGDTTEWVIGDLTTINFDTLDEIMPFYDQYLDYSYFTKTDYGFKLDEENAEQFVEETLSGVEAETNFNFLDMMTDMDLIAKYYVCGGALSGARVDLTMDINYSASGMTMKGKLTEFVEGKVIDYGTTKVEKPFKD